MILYTPDKNITRRLISDMPAADQPLTRYDAIGVSNLSNAELIALIINRPDGLDLSYDILNQFGGIRELINVTPDELESFCGIGHKTAVRLSAALELGARTLTSSKLEQKRITSPSDASDIFYTMISNKPQEHLVVMVLDTRNRILCVKTVYIGSLNSTVVRVAEILKVAIVRNGAAIIIAHNHPSGDPSPSPEDVQVTRQIVKAGRLLDIELLDHIIIGKSSGMAFVSLKERGLGFD